LDCLEIIELSEAGERRNYEFKSSMNWEERSTQLKIIKSVMAMSNIQDGGTIILGIERDKTNNTFKAVGMSKEDLESFDHDKVYDQVYKYADPYVSFHLYPVKCEREEFVVIKVDQFQKAPTICKKNYQEGKNYELEDGAIYTRTLGRRPESSKVMRSIDLREIIDLAVKIGVKVFVQDALNSGFVPAIRVKASPSDDEQFDHQIQELE
jgi:predicted HTH transcriptional regulator